MSSSLLIAEETEQTWVPTHVQVTVLRGRGLRGKGKHGTSDVYTIIQVGKEKYSTGVAEKTTAPEWKEECAFELQPGVLEDGGRSSYPPGSCDLTLTVMHRALIGLDVFLGQAVVPLDKAFRGNVCVKNEWYKLNSKTGKKEKERGEIQVTVTFTRNNLTASMYDLAVKDKSHSTFTKLKERMKGKKRPSEEDSASDILTSGYGTLVRMRNRLPSDGGGEEEYEDDEGGEARRSKMRSYFLRGKLRKSSDTRSSTSLGSESSESSSRGGSLSPTAGISVVVSDLSNSPSNSSNLTADNSPDHTADTSPKLSPLHHGGHFSDDEPGGEITLFVPQPFARLNGSHTQPTEEPGSGKPVMGNSLGLLQRSMPMSMSLQNLRPPRAEEELPKGPAGDGRRWSFDKAGDEEKAAIAAVLEQSGCPTLGFGDSVERVGQTESATNPPPASSFGAVESTSPGKKQRRNLFSHGKSESSGKGQSQSRVDPQHAPTHTQEKQHKGGWFGSKDSKPSPVVSPKLEPSTDHYSPHHPHLPSQPLGDHPWGPPVPPIDPSASLCSPFHHTNPFSDSQTSPPPMSPANPFFPLPRCNPFFGDELANQALRSVPPPLPYLSSSRPPISELFPEHERNPNPALCRGQTCPEDKHQQQPLPPVPTEEERRFIKESSIPFTSSGAMELDAEWDADFELFTAGRLQSPGSPTTHCKPHHTVLNGPQLDHCSNKGALLLTTDMNDALHPQNTCTETSIEAKEVTNRVINSDIMFARFPNANTHECMEGDNIMLAASADASAHSPELGVCLETISSHNTNANASITSNANDTPCHDCDHIHSNSSPCPSPTRKLHNNSPNACSSGIGSSAEEDVPTSLSPSSASEKFSTSSSSEDVEFQTVGGTFHEKCPEKTWKEILDSSESVNPVFNKSDVLSVLCDDASQFIQIKNCPDKEVQPSGAEGHGQLLAPQIAIPPLLPTMVITEELGDDETLCLSPNLPDILGPDLLPKPSVSLQSVNNDLNNDVKEPQGSMEGFSEDTDYTLIDNTKPNIPNIILDDENVATDTSFHIMTSSPCDNPSLKESLVGLEAQKLSNGSPRRPDQLFEDFLNSSYIGTSPDPGQGFDNSLLHTGVSDQSPSSLLRCSLYVSADTQHYQSCQTHHSNASEESVGTPGAGTLPSAYSTVCWAEAGDEVGEFQSVSVADTERISVLGVEDSTNECSQCDYESNQTEGMEVLDAERTVVFESCFTMEEDLGSHTLSNALTDSRIRSVSNDHFSEPPKTECTTLQRSHSEGTVNIQSDSLHMPSFGSDPSLSLSSSFASALPVSDLSPPLPASSSSLTAKSSFPSALSPVPLPNANGSVRSPPSMALQATVPALCTALPATDAPHTALPQETWWQPADQEHSPHPVKPLSTAILVEEKRTEGRSVLEKLKSTIHPGRSAQHSEQEAESKKSLMEGAGSYYHLNHSELVALLVQREAQLQKQKAEFECQRVLLAKREVELKKLKPQVRDLEDYIDTLLVRIMEQTPTLLQVGSKKK